MNPNILTLRAWYELHFVQLFHADARPNTIVAYQSTLNAWEVLTENKPLAAVTSLDLHSFRNCLAALPGLKGGEQMSPATVNKHVRHLCHLFSKAGPPGIRNRDALGLLTVSPWAKQLRTFQRIPQAASLPAIRRMLRACPDDWWRSFVVCAFYLGSRRHALLQIRDEDIDWSMRTIRFRAEHDKKRIERHKPLCMEAQRHLIKLRGRGLLEWRSCKSHFYKQWRAIQEKASLTLDEKFKPHDLKRACGTQLARAGASTWVVKFMLDHAQSDVAGCSYIDPTEAAREAVDKLPSLASLSSHDLANAR